MKQFFFGLLAALVVALPAYGDDVVDPDTIGLGLMTREAAPPPASRDSTSHCLDSMDTGPDDDDLVPTPTAMDGGCSVPEAPLST